MASLVLSSYRGESGRGGPPWGDMGQKCNATCDQICTIWLLESPGWGVEFNHGILGMIETKMQMLGDHLLSGELIELSYTSGLWPHEALYLQPTPGLSQSSACLASFGCRARRHGYRKVKD